MTHARVFSLLLPIAGGLATAALLLRGPDPPAQPGPPLEALRAAYLGSSGCEMCHPSEYASWRATYHRTMTRRPGDLAWDGVLSPSLPVQLDDPHFSFRLSRQGSSVVAQGPNLHVLAQLLYQTGQEAKHAGAERPTEAAIERAIEQVPTALGSVALVTGSHHYLAFWLSAGDDRELRQLPFVYHLEDKQWTPRTQAFLEPPDAPPHIATWNSNCIQCHAVAGEPQETEFSDVSGALHVRYRSRVAELGIACEACHGPGRAHAEHYRNPLWRSRLLAPDPPPSDVALVNPAKLGNAAASAICGQCHAYFVAKDEARFWETGFVGFAPGQALDQSRQLLAPGTSPLEAPQISRELGSIFWPDGTMRVGGREYSGLVASACYARGQGEQQLGCASCHSMHDSDANDQLGREVAVDPDAPCKNCHGKTAEHSRHPAGSPGASCVNCHMPKTAYALQKSIRSHRIQIPSPTRTDVPSACSLCHVDRPLRWFAPGEVTPEDDSVGIGVSAALSGDAAERAIYAAALASSETQRTIGEPLVRALLQVLTGDPYHAVRRIAERGLRDLEANQGDDARFASLPALVPDASVLESLKAARDDRPIVISE